MNKSKFIVFLFSILLSCGGFQYIGTTEEYAKNNPNNVATISSSGCTIIAIDGINVYDGAFKVNPGSHMISVSIHSYTDASNRKAIISHNFLPGKKYAVIGNFNTVQVIPIEKPQGGCCL